ncbi:MAG: OmpP1/FadL family transporter [Burkholderiales bacterium]
MSTLAWKKRAIGAAIGAVTVMAAGSAGAAGFAITTQNASGLGLANSGQAAAAEDASTIWYNPAGLTLIPGRQVVGALNVINTSIKFENNGSTGPTGALSTAGSGGDAGGWAAVPSAYLSWQLNPQLWLGVGLGAPFGLKTEWDDGWVGQFNAIKSEVKTININPTLAWKINETVSLGFGLNAQYLDAELTSRAFAGAVSPLVTITGDDWGWGWNVGAMFNISPATRIGVSYRSEIEYTIEGNVTSSTQIPPTLVNGPARADIDVPAMASIALSQQIGRDWTILADYTYTWWDSIQDLNVVRSNTGATFTTLELKFKNSWRAGIGASYRLNDQWKLRFGTAYDKTPVQDAFRSPRLPDEDRIWLAVGAQWQFSKQGALDLGYAHEFVDDASSNLRVPAPTGLPGGTLRGTYKADVNIFGIQVKYSF